MSRHLTLRLTDEEILLLDAARQPLGLTRSAFLRFAVQQTAKAGDLDQRLTSIEATVSEIAALVRNGGVSLAPSATPPGETNDGMRVELRESLRGILEDGI